MKSCYGIAVTQWHIQPSEFWAMDAEEWWWLFDSARTDPTCDLDNDALMECYNLL